MAKPKRVPVTSTANFERNLEAIERFLDAAGATGAYDALLSELADRVLPNLQRFPGMGRPFLSRPTGSIEALDRIRRISAKLAESELREYVLDSYIVLYAVTPTSVFLLSIKHHRQLSFDFDKLWR